MARRDEPPYQIKLLHTPSIKTIIRELDWLDKVGDPEVLAPRIKELMGMVTKKSSYQRIRDVLEALDNLCKTYGIDYIRHRDDNIYYGYGFDFLNTGDTYINTIIFDYRSLTWKITSWGDMVEKHPRMYPNESRT